MKLIKPNFLCRGALLLTPLSLAVSSALAEPLPGGTLDPTTIPKYVTPLVIPGVMKKSDDPGKDYQIAVRQFRQQMLPTQGCDPANYPNDPRTCRRGKFRPTTVWGYGPKADTPPRVAPVPAAQSQFNNPSFTVEVETNQTVVVDWINDLVNGRGNYLKHLLPVDQTLHWANPLADCLDGTPRTDCMGASGRDYRGPVPMVTHVHGAHVAPESDGYPEAWYLPDAENVNCVDATHPKVGKRVDGVLQAVCTGTLANGFGAVPNTDKGGATFTYTNDQPSTTLWYHDHSLGLTRTQRVRHGRGLLADPSAGRRRGWAGSRQPFRGRPLPWARTRTSLPADRAKIREIPIAIQDKAFNTDGSLFYPADRAFFEGLGTGQPVREQYGLEHPLPAGCELRHLAGLEPGGLFQHHGRERQYLAQAGRGARALPLPSAQRVQLALPEPFDVHRHRAWFGRCRGYGG